MRVRGILIDDVLQRRLLPVDIDRRQIDAPNHDVLSITGDLFDVDIDFQILDLVIEVGAGHCCIPPWHERTLILAYGWLSERLRAWVGNGGAGVGEDAATVEVVRAGTVRCRVCTEPVVTRTGSCVNDDIVALADTKEDPICRVRMYRYEVGCNDSEGMLVERDTDLIVS